MGLTAQAPLRAEDVPAKESALSPIEQQLASHHRQPAQLTPLQRQEDNLLIDHDTVLLEGLARTTTVTPHAAGGVVLGFEVGNGAVALQDFPVGKVYITHHIMT